MTEDERLNPRPVPNLDNIVNSVPDLTPDEREVVRRVVLKESRTYKGRLECVHLGEASRYLECRIRDALISGPRDPKDPMPFDHRDVTVVLGMDPDRGRWEVDQQWTPYQPHWWRNINPGMLPVRGNGKPIKGFKLTTTGFLSFLARAARTVIDDDMALSAWPDQRAEAMKRKALSPDVRPTFKDREGLVVAMRAITLPPPGGMPITFTDGPSSNPSNATTSLPR